MYKVSQSRTNNSSVHSVIPWRSRNTDLIGSRRGGPGTPGSLRAHSHKASCGFKKMEVCTETDQSNQRLRKYNQTDLPGWYDKLVMTDWGQRSSTWANQLFLTGRWSNLEDTPLKRDNWNTQTHLRGVNWVKDPKCCHSSSLFVPSTLY